MQNEHPALPKLEDPRYPDEIGWFVCHERYVHGALGSLTSGRA